MKPHHPPQGVLLDASPHPCPYLEGRTAVLPTRWYRNDIDGDDFDALLSTADRRVGRTLYRPACPSCSACKGLRIPVQEFALSRSQRKVWRRNEDLQVSVGPPVVDARRLELFNRHKIERGLGEEPTSADHYANWLVVSCTRTLETRYYDGHTLIGVGILDMGAQAASSVYFYFDPDASDRSLGVYSVLAELAWLKRLGMSHYYLGLYVQDCQQLAYKARYFPHERLEGGRWRRYAAPTAGGEGGVR